MHICVATSHNRIVVVPAYPNDFEKRDKIIPKCIKYVKRYGNPVEFVSSLKYFSK